MPYIYGPPDPAGEVAFYGVQTVPTTTEPSDSVQLWYGEVIRRDQIDSVLERLIVLCLALDSKPAARVLVLAKELIGKTISSEELVERVKLALYSAQKP
jgi:hypothetical protein